MKTPSVGSLVAMAALSLIAFFAWTGQSPEVSHSAHNHHRQLQAFTFATRTSFPSKLDNTDEWMHYGIYVGVIAAVFILVGLIISITLCIGFCCRRCCCNFSKSGSKTCWVILFVIIYAAIILCCVCVIGFSIAMSTGINNTQKAADTLVVEGVPGAFDNVKDQIVPLPGQVAGVIKGAIDNIQDSAFVAVDDLISFADGKLVEADQVLVSASRILNETGDQFDLLRLLFTRLAAYQESGLISGIPSNDTVPDVKGLTSNVLSDGRAAVGDMRSQIANLSQSVEEAKSQATYSSSLVQGVVQGVNDTIGGIVSTIDSSKQSFIDMDISAKYVHGYDNYIDLQNKIRLPVMIVLAVMPLIMSGLWFLGACTSKRRCMLVGFWWAAGICWLVLLLGAIHVVLFIPIKDVCRERNELVVAGANQFVFTNGTNYASSVGITSPAQAADLINSAVTKILDDPDLILDCKGDATLVTQLGLDLPGAFGIREAVANVTDQVREEANKMNISAKIQDAQPTFSGMDKQIEILSGNITSFNGTLANYTTEYAKARVLFVPSNYWNSTTQAQADTSLEAVNNITNAPTTIPKDVWTFDTIENMNPNSYAGITNQQRNILTGNKQAILNLIKLNVSVIEIEASFDEYSAITVHLNDLLMESTQLVSNTSKIVFDSWARINASTSLPGQIVDKITELLNPAIDQLVELARFEDLGRCKFVGDFMRNGWNKGVCKDLGASAGGAAISMFILAMIWFVSWPIILSSKAFFAGNYDLNSVVDNDLWYEMDAAKQNKP